jgi:hypothetical protein
MSYELWDTESANLLGDYPTEQEALIVVRRTALAHGSSAVSSFALAFEDEEGETHPIAAGEALLDRAHSAIPRSNQTRSRIAS